MFLQPTRGPVHQSMLSLLVLEHGFAISPANGCGVLTTAFRPVPDTKELYNRLLGLFWQGPSDLQTITGLGRSR